MIRLMIKLRAQVEVGAGIDPKIDRRRLERAPSSGEKITIHNWTIRVPTILSRALPYRVRTRYLSGYFKFCFWFNRILDMRLQLERLSCFSLKRI